MSSFQPLEKKRKALLNLTNNSLNIRQEKEKKKEEKEIENNKKIKRSEIKILEISLPFLRNNNKNENKITKNKKENDRESLEDIKENEEKRNENNEIKVDIDGKFFLFSPSLLIFVVIFLFNRIACFITLS